MKTSYAAKRQGDFFAEPEARASPSPHTYVEHPRSRRPDPACRRFVHALAALQFSTVRASSLPSPSNDYDDLPDLIDTSPSPGDAGRAQAARQQRVHSVSPAKLIMDDDDGSVDMDELVFRPNPVERLEISNSDDDE